MPEDLDLAERFEALKSATFGDATAPTALRARVARRRRRRALAVGGGLGAVILLGAVAATVGTRSSPADQVRSGSTVPAATTLPATYGSEPRLDVGAVPAGMSSSGCGLEDYAPGGVVVCTLGLPQTAVPDGINLAWTRDPVSDELLAAWNRGDAETVATARLGQHEEPARFIEIGGRTVLTIGETDRLSGDEFDQSDRVTRTYEVLVGDSMVQINAEGETEAQLAEVISGLSTDPVDPGFHIPAEVLPPGAAPLAQGPQRLWFEPDRLDPERSIESSGTASGMTYEVGGERAPLVVMVVRDVTAPSYIEAWTDQQERLINGTAEPVEQGGRMGTVVGLTAGGVADQPPSSLRVAMAVDDGTVVIVEGPMALRSQVFAIAATTVPTEATTSGHSDEPTSAEEAEPTGWYVPRGLPEGWVVERAVAQAADGSGEAQLWLVSPTRNQIIVTLKVPQGGAWHTDDAVPHPIPGLDGLGGQSVYEESFGGGDPKGALVGSWPGAIVRVDWLEPSAGDVEGSAADAAGPAELDELMSSLRAASTHEWRGYLGAVSQVDEALIEADDLVALPDEI